MWNPIVSGSTDLWQHVWMYYSMPLEVRAAEGWTQDYGQARPVNTETNDRSTRPSQMQRAEVHRQKQLFFFSFSVVTHYATDWNLESIHRAELWLRAKAAKRKKKKKNQRWCLTPAGSHRSSAEQILLQLTHKVSTFYFYCCHVQSAPLRIGSPPPSSPPVSPSPSPSFTPSLHRLTPPTQRGPSWDVNHAVN